MKPGSAIAWIENRKSRTQRVVNPQPEDGMKWGGTIMESTSKKVKRGDCFFYTGELPLVEKQMHIHCPYGRPGDRLQLLTQWAVRSLLDVFLPSDISPKADVWTAFDGPKPDWCGKTRSPIYMPGWIREAMPHPEIISIEARRIHGITEAEAMEDGIFETPRDPGFDSWSTHGMRDYYCTPRTAYKALWNSINAKRGYPWESNPWVWNIKFQSRYITPSGYKVRYQRMMSIDTTVRKGET